MDYQVDWPREEAATLSRLQALLRIDTTNPPGNETPAARYVADEMAAIGLEPVVLESAPGRGSVVARLPGTGQAPPLLLMSHLDVVPAEPEHWQHPPFGGEIHDGYLWGRGALDTKNLLAQHMALMRLFSERSAAGARLSRDLILMATADEEVGGAMGAHWLAESHPELVRAEYALNEGGGATVELGGRLYMTVQTAEKGLARFRLVARGQPGHASMPRDDNAVVRLAEAVAAVGRAALPAHMTETVAAYLRLVAASQPPDVAALLREMAEGGERFDERLAQLPIDDERRRYLHAATHNTAAPTVLRAGGKVNVFPSEATARVDGRTLPGFSNADFERELRPHLPDGVELAFEDEAPPIEAGLASPLYDAIEASVAALAPDVVVVPMLLTGATDAKAIVPLGTKVYGFGPMRYEKAVDGTSLVHGHNERISLANLAFGTRVLYDVVERFCG